MTATKSTGTKVAEGLGRQAVSRFHLSGHVRRLYDWVVHWADTPHAQLALFLIAFAEASFFPVPPDVLLLAMGVSAAKRSFRFAAITTVGSVLGGLMGYTIGWGLWASVDQLFYTYVPGFSPALFERVSTMFNDHAFWAVFTAGFTPIPYKIFTVSAGVASIQIAPFILASIVSRGLRFFILGGLLYFFGPTIKGFIDKHFARLTVIFTVLLIGGFVALKFVFDKA